MMMPNNRSRLLAAAVVGLAACSDSSGGNRDAGAADAIQWDGGTPDAGRDWRG